MFRTRTALILASLLIAGIGRGAQSAPATRPATAQADTDWAFLDNGKIRLGVKRSSGGAIAHFSLAGPDARNLINHYDRGRLVQQSYYGNEDGSLWGKQPWRWNPVQGGEYRGAPAKLLELKTDGKTTLYAKTLPKHWASGVDLPDVTMEQWVTLSGRIAHVQYRMSYAGTTKHVLHDQEIPAFFVEPDLDTLVLYDGDKPWAGGELHRSKPGWPNESRKFAENWAAYVGKDDFGVGAYVPVANVLTCYRYGDGGKDSCSYFAPLTRFAITPGTVFEYDLYMTIGKTAEIREAFGKVRADRAAATRPTVR